jgi:hypothetical protein
MSGEKIGYGKRIDALYLGENDPQKYRADQILGSFWAAEVTLYFRRI